MPSATYREAKGQPTMLYPMDLGELLRRESASLDTRLRAMGMALDLKPMASSLPVLLDQSSMQVVLAQMVDFASSAMATGSTLQVLARIDGAHAVVNFADSPPGISEARLGRMFDDCARSSLHRASEREEAQRIARCTKIIGEHNGRIYAAPSPLGSLGITLRLPLLDQSSCKGNDRSSLVLPTFVALSPADVGNGVEPVTGP